MNTGSCFIQPGGSYEVPFTCNVGAWAQGAPVWTYNRADGSRAVIGTVAGFYSDLKFNRLGTDRVVC